MRELKLPNMETIANAEADEAMAEAKSEALDEAVSDEIEEIEQKQ